MEVKQRIFNTRCSFITDHGFAFVNEEHSRHAIVNDCIFWGIVVHAILTDLGEVESV